MKPNINIFEYPSLKLHRILRDGTEEAYAHLDFSPKGDKLASVGSAPDYMLTLWDWKNEQVILRSKAFSQDVYKVAFSPEDEGHLCSSGSGHIRYVAHRFVYTLYLSYILRNRKPVPCFDRVIYHVKTHCGKLEEQEILWKRKPTGECFHSCFSSPKLLQLFLLNN